MKRFLVGWVVICTLPLLAGCSSSPKERSLVVTVTFPSEPDSLLSNVPRMSGREFGCLPKGIKKDLGEVLAGKSKVSLGKKISLLDLSWQNTTIEMYDGSRNLVGVPDFISPLLNTNGTCSLKIVFTHLIIPLEPIRLQSGTSWGWDIPQSKWLKGSLTLDGSGGDF